jgi:hypothetical protein
MLVRPGRSLWRPLANAAVDVSGHCGWDPVELVEMLMLAQPDRFALHFEIPAVLHGFLVQFAIRSDIAGAVFVAVACDLLTRRLQLIEEALETTADAGQRRGAFLLQFLEQALVLGPSVFDAHDVILSAVNGGYVSVPPCDAVSPPSPLAPRRA